MAPFVERWAGSAVAVQGVRGRGGLPFVAASRVGFSSHRLGHGQGAPKHDSDEVMFTRALTHGGLGVIHTQV